MKVKAFNEFSNGIVYALMTDDKYPIEVTDTFLPFYTKDAISQKTNVLKDYYLGSRDERWMIGVSCMSGCPVGCKFCATGKLPRWRNLTATEIVQQVMFITGKHWIGQPYKSKEFKINYTRMGEPFLNIDAVRRAIDKINQKYPDTHHYVSTVGLRGSDFSWIEGNTTLQISLHSTNEDRRHELIPINNLMSIEELGQIRTKSNLKTTVNLTLVDEEDFDIEVLKKYFDPKYFFIKISPINENECSIENEMGSGIVEQLNLA